MSLIVIADAAFDPEAVEGISVFMGRALHVHLASGVHVRVEPTDVEGTSAADKVATLARLIAVGREEEPPWVAPEYPPSGPGDRV